MDNIDKLLSDGWAAVRSKIAQMPDIANQWALGVQQRTSHPLETLAAEAEKWRTMPVGELASNLVGVGHTAWHGSSHLFDKFKNEAIGTGEGAQAYGHGLYLAENPDVATGYRGRLSTNYIGRKGEQIPSGEVWTEAKDAVKSAIDMHPDRARAIASHIQDYVDSGSKAEDYFKEFDVPSSLRPAYQAAIDKFSGITPNPGALYKTDIPDSAIPKMLDWDKPLSEQSQYVRNAFNNHSPITNSPQSMTGGDLVRAMGESEGGVDAASSVLHQIGIPGIKYLDGSSRTAGEGTRNFVMFNPDDIRILERNSVPTGQVPWSQDVNKGMLSGGNNGY